jgi:AAA domain
MGSRFSEATRQKLKLRAAIDGPSGSGKSVTALRFAHVLASGGRIFAINSEVGGLQLYAGETFDGDGPFHFLNAKLTSFAPTEYTAAIEEAGREGAAVIIIDSLSHAWEGADGALEQVNKKGGNSFTAWKDVTPQHRRMIEAILQSPAHVICTMRSKTEYVLEENEKGKQVPRKIGMAPIQRSGAEYEFDIYCSMDWSHLMTVAKSRCRAVDGQIVMKPGGNFMKPVIAWLEGGAVVTPDAAPAVLRATDAQIQEIAGLSAAAGNPVGSEKFRKDLVKRFSVQEPADLRPEQAEELLQRLRQVAAKKKTTKAEDATAPAVADPHATIRDRVAASGNGTHAGWATPPQSQPAMTTLALEGQLAIIREWLGELGERGFTPDDWRAFLTANYNVDSGTKLNVGQADEVIKRISMKALEARAAAGERF